MIQLFFIENSNFSWSLILKHDTRREFHHNSWINFYLKRAIKTKFAPYFLKLDPLVFIINFHGHNIALGEGELNYKQITQDF